MKNNKYLCKIIGLLLIGCFSISTIYSQTQIDTDTIITHLRGSVLSNGSQPPDSTVGAYMGSLKSDGSWNDVNYADKSVVIWSPYRHLNRLLAMCKAYNMSKSIYYHSGAVKAQIYTAFTYWNKSHPKSSNWFNNDIGGPMNYGACLLTLKTTDGFGFGSDTLITLANAYLNYYNVSASIYPFALTGSNQNENLLISMYKACILDSTDELKRNFDTAFAGIQLFGGKSEGMKADKSYYFHGRILYNWGYGSVFLLNITNMIGVARNTAFAASTSQLNTVIDFVLDGQQWLQQKSTADFNAIGRGISNNGGLNVSFIRTGCLNDLVKICGGYRLTELNNYSKFVIGGNVSFQSPGNKQFWKSDFMIQHGKKFYLSVKTPSNRTIATESVNGESLKAKYLSWGSTNIMINGDEYQNAIPVWDWTRIPGTTTANDPNANFTKMPTNKFTPSNAFAGGVSNGVYGLSADAFIWDSVSGNKSYFFTPDGMYCMGSGIASTKKGRVIVTSVNQCLSSGNITIDSAGKQSAFFGQQKRDSTIKWVHHNNVGYLFPNYGNITVANQIQTGSWSLINSSEDSTTISNKIFSLWVNHDTLPNTGTYEYIVIPNMSVSQFSKWSSNCFLKKIANNSSLQAFLDDSAKVYAISFYSAGGVLLDTTNNFYIRSNKPALLLIQKQKNGYTISLADPTQLLDSIGITSSLKLYGPNSTVNGDSTFINFLLPNGDSAGKTITNTYLLTNPLPIHFVDVKSVLNENSNIAINWDVSNEEGIVRYEVEKSNDGKNYTILQSIDADNSFKGSYGIVDNNVSVTNYYRIKAIANNGVVSYSAVSHVANKDLANTHFRLFPNPLHGNHLKLSLENIPSGKYYVTLFNPIGQKNAIQAIIHLGGNEDYSMNLGNISNGVYRVVIREEGSNQLVGMSSLLVKH